ncbi:MAG TPA: N-acetylneuraminate synthase family protein [Bacteroidota bacterium]
MKAINIGGRLVGPGHPVFVIAEVGINHNGDVELAKSLVNAAFDAGCDAVKFQKRTPEVCVPSDQRNLLRDTPWGVMTYLEYRRRLEFRLNEYAEVDRECRRKGIIWFASCWDRESVDFMEMFDPPCYKISSACLTDTELLLRVKITGKPVILSTGMSTMEEIFMAVNTLGQENLLIAHTTSAYPCDVSELNLRVIGTFRELFECPIGYSGHEVGLAPTWAAVALGASFVERHITLDRSMWGSDQAASVEPSGMKRLVENIRDIERALGDGVKCVYESEHKNRARLRTVLGPGKSAGNPSISLGESSQ